MKFVSAQRILILSAAGIGLALSDPSHAVHDGGVGACKACHAMHNSEDGLPIDPNNPGGNPYLLIRNNPSDVCLLCHATANGSVFGTDPLNPPPEKGGGNFVFLLQDNLNDGPDGLLNPISGNHAGHNTVSSDWGVPEDPDNSVAPGGTFPASQLSCSSCHDPHGNPNFRMLRGAGSTTIGGFTFVYDAPLADGISLLAGEETTTNHTAYHQGWADWCANCHGHYHDESAPGFDHPADHQMEGEHEEYNRYAGPSNPYGGNFSTAYIPQTPIQDPAITISSTFGASTSSRVTCMSCHRAHATSAPHSTRWDPNIEFLSDDGQVSGSYPLPNPYPEPDQRALCVKCHYEEAEAHGWGQPCMECHRDLGHN